MGIDEYLLKISLVCFPDELLTSSLPLAMEPSHRTVLGVDIHTKQICLDDVLLKLIIVDISTNLSFGPPRPSFFRDSSAAIFAFSKSNRRYLDLAKEWYFLFREHIPHPSVPIAFISLQSDSEVVTTSEGQALAQELGVDYFEMAADDLQSLDTVVKSLSRKVLEHFE